MAGAGVPPVLPVARHLRGFLVVRAAGLVVVERAADGALDAVRRVADGVPDTGEIA